MSTKVFAAMSGGVDSSVAALLLREQGFAVSGVHLRLVRNEMLGLGCESGCCSLSDAEDARLVAYRLGLPFYVFDLSEEFQETVIRRFVDGYGAGETPNPCMDCNRFIKWGALLHRAEVLGCGYLATGHYARIRKNPQTERWELLRGLDDAKDQSYFLAHLTQHQLAHTLLPLGELRKPQVRQLAEENGFCNARKRDSQDLCFAPDGDYAAFWSRMTGREPETGRIVDQKGTVLGSHRGLLRYTLGQHKGLGLATAEPLYVCGKDMKTNTLNVGAECALYTRSLTARECNYIAIDGLREPLRAEVQTRYHQTPRGAAALPLPNGRFRVEFDELQRAVTPGQTVVLYDGDRVLAAGVIDSTE
jgi:tRNA-specific 2-thiouridylase